MTPVDVAGEQKRNVTRVFFNKLSTLAYYIINDVRAANIQIVYIDRKLHINLKDIH